jgi:hypothetical protein
MNKVLVGFALLVAFLGFPASSEAAEKVRFAYISDSPGSSAPYWVAKDAGIFKKYGSIPSSSLSTAAHAGFRA